MKYQAMMYKSVSDLLTDSIERLIKALGLNDMSLSAGSKNKPQELAFKAQLQDLYLLNDSMFKDDIHEVATVHKRYRNHS